MLDEKQESRPSALECLRHPWLSADYEVLLEKYQRSEDLAEESKNNQLNIGNSRQIVRKFRTNQHVSLSHLNIEAPLQEEDDDEEIKHEAAGAEDGEENDN